MISMRDVARLAGVSVATVSAVINGKATVGIASVRRVEEAMKALDYHPDQVARSLRVGRTNVIGMIVPDISNQFFAEIMRSVEETSEKSGFSVIMCDSNEDSGREQRHLSTLYSRRVDGVLLASSVSDAAQDRLTLRRFPIVFVDAVPAGIKHGAVVVDNAEGAYAATRYLIELGHRRIAIITGSLDRSVGLDRLEGYRKAMQEAELVVPDEYIRFGDYHVESGYKWGRELMGLSVPPTAIFACNNAMTLGLLRALADLGIRCPAQVSVVGFDDVDWATSFTPRLTCVAQPTYEIGKLATEMLLQKVRAADGEATYEHPNIILRAELRVRESAAAPAP
jgi:LacI family transcriptional regulator